MAVDLNWNKTCEECGKTFNTQVPVQFCELCTTVAQVRLIGYITQYRRWGVAPSGDPTLTDILVSLPQQEE